MKQVEWIMFYVYPPRFSTCIKNLLILVLSNSKHIFQRAIVNI